MFEEKITLQGTYFTNVKQIAVLQYIKKSNIIKS